MKKRLFNASLWLIMLLFGMQVSAQADPSLTTVDTSTNDVTVTNLGDANIDITNYWVCLGPGQYRQLSALSIVAGDYALSPSESVTFDFPLITGENADGAGGLGLFSTNSFGSSSPTILVDYMQWGGPNQDRSGQAVTAGRWDNVANFVDGQSPYTTSIGGSAMAWASTIEFTALLSGVQENPAVFTAATGSIQATLTGNQLVVSGSFEGLRGELYTPAAGGDHIHRAIAGRNGGIELPLTAVLSDGNTAGQYLAADNTFTLTNDQMTAIIAREFYVNIHSSVFTGGELRGQLLPNSDQYYQAALLGSNEVPSINTTAGGNLVFELNGDQLTVSGSFDNLSSQIRVDLANGAHIHEAFAGRNGAVVFPLNPTYDGDNQGAIIETANNTFTLSAAQLALIEEHGFYINIHSVNFPAGELRGQILPISASVLRAELTGFQEVPSISSEADGRIYVTYNGEGSFSVGGTFNDLSGDLFLPAAGGIHLHMAHAGINGPVEFIITPDVASDNRNAVIRPSENTFAINDTQLEVLLSRGANRSFYLNIHSETFQGGELRGQVLPLAQSYFGANLSGQNEIPQPVVSTGVGNVELELTGDQLTVTGGFSNLSNDYDSSPAVAGGAHLHLGDAASTGGVDIILNTTVDADARGGIFIPAQNTFTITPVQKAALLSGGFYVNIHTVENGAGEIRGQVLRDDNAFPLATTITSPDNGNINLIDDSATPYVVTWDATTDPDGDLVVYAYQLATNADFTDLLINTNVGTSLEYNVENSVVFNAIAAAPVNALLYQRVLASDGSVATPSEAQTTTLNCVADGGTVQIDIEATGNPNSTTSISEDGLSAVICVDDRMDPLVVIHENDATTLSYRYVVTDNSDESTILAIFGSNEIDLDGAGIGTCQIWGWSYRGTPDNGAGFIGGPLADLDAQDCSDISENAITVVREAANGGTVSIDLEATGNPNGTTSFNGDTEAVICLDTQMDPIVVVHENPGAENLSYRYVITDEATGLILNVVNTNSIDLNGVAAGTCQIWGWSYRGVPGNGLDQVGEPLSSLDDLDCSDISDNFVRVIREAADGGTVSIDLEATG
ncbi:CHRD domain-containing protein, partial [Dokdonia sp.]